MKIFVLLLLLFLDFSSCSTFRVKSIDININDDITKLKLENIQKIQFGIGSQYYDAYLCDYNNCKIIVLFFQNKVKAIYTNDKHFYTPEGYNVDCFRKDIHASDIMSIEKAASGSEGVVLTLKSGWKLYFSSKYFSYEELPDNAIINYIYLEDSSFFKCFNVNIQHDESGRLL